MGHYMNRELHSLYQNELKQHYTQPLGQIPLDTPSHQFEGYNASCGDEILFSLKTSNSCSEIESIAFEGDSCAICTASASLLCEVTQTQSPAAFRKLYQWLDDSLSASSISVPLLDIAEDDVMNGKLDLNSTNHNHQHSVNNDTDKNEQTIPSSSDLKLTTSHKENWQQKLDKLKPLLSISQFPSRINCALLPWQTFAQALKNPLSAKCVNKTERK